MTGPTKKSVSVQMSFEKAQLPPFNDILVLGSRCPVGVAGITKSIEFLIPDNYEIIPIEDDVAEAMVVNRTILKRMSGAQVKEIICQHVLPHMSAVEMIRVDFSVKVMVENITIEG